MARNDFAIERSRKISIAIAGYDAVSASKVQQLKIAKRSQRLRVQKARQQHEKKEAERLSRYGAACSEMDDFNSLNEALSKAIANASLLHAFEATAPEAVSPMQ